MADIEELEKQFSQEELMTPEGIAKYAHALINVQRKEQSHIMEEIKKKQDYFDCDDENKELFKQIVSGYNFTEEVCLPELAVCYMQLTIKKSEKVLGYDIACIFCREKKGKSYWTIISPADYFLMIQIMGNYKPGYIHSFAPYFFFRDDIADIVDVVVKNQIQAISARKKVKVVR